MRAAAVVPPGKGGLMYCIYNTGGLCYLDNENVKECLYVGCEAECDNAEEG